MKVSVKHCATFLLFLTVTAVNTANGRYGNFYDPTNLNSFLSGLGDRINSHVQRTLGNVNRQVMHNIETALPPYMNKYGNPGWNVWPRIKPVAPPVVPDLSHLGEQINHQVQESLKPLRLRVEMSQGKGGTTVVTYGDKSQVILMDGLKFTCPGQIVMHPTTGVECTKTLVRYRPTYNDVCSTSSYSRVNGIYCFGNAIFECINNECKCKGGQMYSLENLKNLCGPKYGTNKYVIVDYYPNLSDPNRVKFKENNFNICENPGEDNCLWHTSSFVVTNGAIWQS